MKVFKFTIIDGYGGGEAIVAANSAYEAYGLLVQTQPYYAEHFSMKSHSELEVLTANVEEPTIISIEYYVE